MPSRGPKGAVTGGAVEALRFMCDPVALFVCTRTKGQTRRDILQSDLSLAVAFIYQSERTPQAANFLDIYDGEE